MIIREERPEDFGEIYRLVETAFKTAKVADGNEQDFVDTLRSRDSYIPRLALVAELDGRLVGHIMLTRTVIAGADGRNHEALMLAPLSVLREYRLRGIGALLVESAFEKASKMGFRSVFLAGDPAYYSRFGFRASTGFGIGNASGIPEQFALAAELIPGALDGIRGTVSIE